MGDRRTIGRLAGVCVVVASLGGASPATAATETSVDCGAGADLQAAIDAAPKGAILDISGTCAGTFTVGKSLVLKGVSSAVLDAQGAGTTLTVSAGKVRVTKLTITGAFSADNTAGGILNSGVLTLVRVTVQRNDGEDGVGGIENLGTLTLRRSVVTANGGSDLGGIENRGVATIDRSTISFNSGDGISNSGTLAVSNSTVNNQHMTYGAGIDNTGSATVIRSTIAKNEAFNGSGGGIFNYAGGTLTVTESTISGNDGDESAGGILNDGTVTITATIVAGNTIGNGDESFDCQGISSNGYNLFGTPCGTAQPTDQVGTFAQPLDPLLKALGSYGGPTQTMVPRPTSPAVNRIPIGATGADGSIALCPSSGTTDQRGISRPQSGACDIGSVERKPKE